MTVVLNEAALGALLESEFGPVGIDTAIASLRLARGLLGGVPTVHLVGMDATHTGFRDGTFDLTVCVQNGISAFACDQRALLAEAVRHGIEVRGPSVNRSIDEFSLEGTAIRMPLGAVRELTAMSGDQPVKEVRALLAMQRDDAEAARKIHDEAGA